MSEMNRIEDEIQQSLQEVVSIGTAVTPYSYQDPEVRDESYGDLSDLQELSRKIELCLKRQTKVRFITKEIAEIIKRQA